MSIDEESLRAYNIDVANFDTYFVTDSASAAADLWVHNQGCGEGKSLRPEAKYEKSKKHGVKWTEGPATAKKTGIPQGQWGSKLDLDYAGKKASTLESGEGGWFDLPAGSSSIVHFSDGSTVKANRIWVRNNGSGTFHGYPAE